MQIAITGHTSGIGKAFYEGFSSLGHEVVGFNSKTDGNMSSDLAISKIVEQSKDCDILIINAYDSSSSRRMLGFGQTSLLYKMWDEWRGKDKIIVVIGSRSIDIDRHVEFPYATHKVALDYAVRQLRNVRTKMPRLLYLKPGYVDTPQVKSVTGIKKMNPVEVFDILNWAITHKNQILDITFDP